MAFEDYTGRKVENVNNIITLNGRVVENIDTKVMGTYVVTTIATDRFGVESLPVVREIEIIDTVSPVVKSYDEVVIIEKGHTYSEKDIEAYDEVSDVEIIRLNNVDFSKEGTYEIAYKVIDRSGNETIFTRTVIVKNSNSSFIWFIISFFISFIACVCVLVFRIKKYI